MQDQINSANYNNKFSALVTYHSYTYVVIKSYCFVLK